MMVVIVKMVLVIAMMMVVIARAMIVIVMMKAVLVKNMLIRVDVKKEKSALEEIVVNVGMIALAK